MKSDAGEGQTGPIFRNGEEAKKSLEQLVAQLENFRRTLGSSALSAAVGEELLPLAESLNDGAADIIDIVAGLEEKEPFGDEESYWNVLRYFCVDGNVGAVRTLPQLWDHLALTFDMNGETLDTLADTLEDWTGDIETDALAKYKLTGKFIAAGGGYVFYENPLAAAKRKASDPRTPRPVAVAHPPSLKEVEVSAPEVTSEELVIADRVLGVLQDFGVSVKQAVVVKAIIESDRSLTHADVLSQIESLVAEGKVFKFKPVKGGPAHLALRAEDVAYTQSEAEVVEAAEREEEIDLELATEILSILSARGRKPGQMMATSQMINSINDTDRERPLTISELNRAARQLATKQLVRTDMGSPLAGKGKAKSRAKSRSVFRVGVPDADTQSLVRELLANSNLEEYFK